MLDFSRLPDVSEEHPELTDPYELTYAAHMKAREMALNAVFGEPTPDGCILSPGDPNLTINWPGGGVYQYAPSGTLGSWHYVTSGLSQPFSEESAEGESDDEVFSGYGCEFVIATPTENNWAPDVLLNLVRHLLFNENARPIYAGHRIPCGGPLVLGTDTKLTFLVAMLSPEYENQLELPGGRCELVHLVGATQGEVDAAKADGPGTRGSFILTEVMREIGVGTVSDSGRECLTRHRDFEKLWKRFEKALSADP